MHRMPVASELPVLNASAGLGAQVVPAAPATNIVTVLPIVPPDPAMSSAVFGAGFLADGRFPSIMNA